MIQRSDSQKKTFLRHCEPQCVSLENNKKWGTIWFLSCCFHHCKCWERTVLWVCWKNPQQRLCCVFLVSVVHGSRRIGWCAIPAILHFNMIHITKVIQLLSKIFQKDFWRRNKPKGTVTTLLSLKANQCVCLYVPFLKPYDKEQKNIWTWISSSVAQKMLPRRIVLLWILLCLFSTAIIIILYQLYPLKLSKSRLVCHYQSQAEYLWRVKHFHFKLWNELLWCYVSLYQFEYFQLQGHWEKTSPYQIILVLQWSWKWVISQIIPWLHLNCNWKTLRTLRPEESWCKSTVNQSI